MTENEILMLLYQTENEVKNMKALSMFIMSSLQNGNVSMLKAVFTNVDVKQVTLLMGLSLLRFSYMATPYVPEWFVFRDRWIAYLKDQNLFEPMSFRGLLDYDVYESEYPEFEALIGVHDSLRNK